MGEGYSESRRCLAPLVPVWEIAACPAERLLDSLHGIDALVPYGTQIDRAVIERGTFGLIQQFGVGVETIDIPSATAAGVWVARVPSAGTGNAESVAEHAILLMLALSRRLNQAADSLRRRIVGEPAGIALAGKTACIIGLGGVGAALGLRLQAFDMRLLGVRRRTLLGAPRGVAMRVFSPTRLHEAIAQADYTILCVTMDESNRNLIGKAALAAVKQGSFLINVARGGLVDTEALVEALAAGRLAGAGLDVVGQEPIDPHSPLLGYNVLVTPHIAGVTSSSYEGIAQVVARNLQRYENAEPPAYALNAPPSPRRRGQMASR